MHPAAQAYLRRHALYPPRSEAPPHPRLGLAVTIPCHDEPHLLATLADLWVCRRPDAAVEVIVAVNASREAPRAVHERNAHTLREVRAWLADKETDSENGALRIHLLHFDDLPPRKAGVGLARKLAMDEAVYRLARAETARASARDAGGNGNGSGGRDGDGDGGIIACLDADCRVREDYLTALEAHFRAHPHSPACAIRFAHDWAAQSDPVLREGIVQYELHLRVVVAGLRLAGYPFAFHTVGSAMAVQAGVYVRQGGMNQRKGAEDFHFLAKLMPLGGFTRLEETVVTPSGRVSHRVPFGTGRAMADWRRGSGASLPTYDPRSYRDLAALLARLERLYGLQAERLPAFLAALPAPVGSFLDKSGFAARLDEIRRNSASAATFHARLLRWLDRFRVLKYLHHVREHHYPPVPVVEAAAELLEWSGADVPRGREALDGAALLETFRRWEMDLPG